MDHKLITWNDGTGDTLEIGYEGVPGTAAVTLTSDQNQGLDRSAVITVTGPRSSVPVTVRQAGRRQPLDASDAQLLTSDNKILAVLKNGSI